MKTISLGNCSNWPVNFIVPKYHRQFLVIGECIHFTTELVFAKQKSWSIFFFLARILTLQPRGRQITTGLCTGDPEGEFGHGLHLVWKSIPRDNEAVKTNFTIEI